MDISPTLARAENAITSAPVTAAIGRIRRIHDGPLLDAVYRLRADAWATDGVMQHEVTDGRYIDSTDSEPGVENLGYMDGDQLVGTIRISVHASIDEVPLPEPMRISPKESPLGLLSRLGVHRDWRRQGIGYLLIDYSLHRMRELGLKGIVAYTSVPHVCAHMESHGFTAYRHALVRRGPSLAPTTGLYLAL
jgi:GNAT superfamily N-acetyltransferase